jgi:hypothetical protein
MIELRIVIPNKVTKPTSAPMDSAPAFGELEPEEEEHTANEREWHIDEHEQQVPPVAKDHGQQQ